MTAEAMSRRSAKALRVTAVHEAGHAVQAWLEGIRTTRVTIVPSGDALGTHTHSKVPVWIGRMPAPREIVGMQCKARCAMAGYIAQRIAFPRSRWRVGGTSDIEQAVALIGGLSRYSDEQQYWYRLFEVRVDGDLRRHWPAVEAVADALLAARTLPGDQIVDIAERAMGYTPLRLGRIAADGADIVPLRRTASAAAEA